MDSRRKACQAKKVDCSESTEQSVCASLPYFHLIARETWNWVVNISWRCLLSTVNCCISRAMGGVGAFRQRSSGWKAQPGTLATSIPGLEAYFWVPCFSGPSAWISLGSGCLKVASPLLKLSCWTPEKSYKIPRLSVNNRLLSVHMLSHHRDIFEALSDTGKCASCLKKYRADICHQSEQIWRVLFKCTS